MGNGMMVGKSWIRLWLGAILVSSLAGLPASLSAAEDSQPAAAAAAEEEFSLRDDFEKELALSWKPVRPDPTHVSLDKHAGMLTITTQQGSIHAYQVLDLLNLEKRAKNLYMLPNPAKNGGDFVVTTRVVSFAPKTNWQQAGLMIYDDDDNYLKCDLEWSRGAPSDIRPVCLRETKAKSHYFAATPDRVGNTFWLRVIKRGSLYTYDYSLDGKVYQPVGEKPWGNGSPKSVGVFAKNGNNADATDIDAQFDFFEVRSLTEDERNDPAYVERKKLRGDWKVASAKMSGKALEKVSLSRFTFEDGFVTVLEGKKTLKTEYSVDASKDPKVIALVGLFQRQPGPVYLVYAVEGDTLTLCLNTRPGAEPPASLTTEEGDGRMLLTLKRVEE